MTQRKQELNVKNETGNINGINYFMISGHVSNGRVLIFLPGIGAYKENYCQHLAYFRDHYQYIYAIDLPEQGSKGVWSIKCMVDNLNEFIHYCDSNEIQCFHLSGHSIGALAVFSSIISYNNCYGNSLFYKTIESIKDNEKNDLLYLNELLFNKRLNKKVSKLILYSPPNSFNIVLPKRIAGWIKTLNQSKVRRLLNFMVNFPMILLKKRKHKQFVDFKITKTGKPQYFNLVLNDHILFFDYIQNYKTVFELNEKNSYPFSELITNSIGTKKILIQYGLYDWVIKPFIGKNEFERKYSIHSSIDIVSHKHIGHFLRKRYSIDINLNKQFITNKNVLEQTTEFIEKS